MKRIIQYLALISLLTVECKNDTVSADAPACIVKMINQIKSQDKWNPPATIYRYIYKGRVVHFIPQRCCDIPSVLLDDQCAVVCSPDGGISGGGDGKCPDFFATRSDEKLIWQDSRK